jgi:hypothetical protein
MVGDGRGGQGEPLPSSPVLYRPLPSIYFDAISPSLAGGITSVATTPP